MSWACSCCDRGVINAVIPASLVSQGTTGTWPSFVSRPKIQGRHGHWLRLTWAGGTPTPALLCCVCGAALPLVPSTARPCGALLKAASPVLDMTTTYGISVVYKIHSTAESMESYVSLCPG